MKKKLLLGLIGLLLIILPLSVGCTKTAPMPLETSEQLKIGVIMPISGPMSMIGMAFARGWELYFDKINEQGGLTIGGKKYTFKVIIDDGGGGNPEIAGNAAKKLVLQDKVNFVFGEMIDTSSLAINSVTEANKVLHFISWSLIIDSPLDPSPDKPFTVRLEITPDAADPVALSLLEEKYPNAKSIGIVAPGVGYEPMIEELKVLFAERGLEVAGVDIWEWGTTDFTPIMIKVLANKPDVVWTEVAAQANYVYLAARQLGFEGPFVSSAPLGPDQFIRVAPESSTDIIVTAWDPYEPNAVQKEIIDRWTAKYAEPFVSEAAQGWDQGWILTQVLQRANSIDAEKVVAAVESMTNVGDVKVSLGDARFGGKARYGVNRILIRPIPLCHIVDGKTYFIGSRLSTRE